MSDELNFYLWYAKSNVGLCTKFIIIMMQLLCQSVDVKVVLSVVLVDSLGYADFLVFEIKV